MMQTLLVISALAVAGAAAPAVTTSKPVQTEVNSSLEVGTAGPPDAAIPPAAVRVQPERHQNDKRVIFTADDLRGMTPLDWLTTYRKNGPYFISEYMNPSPPNYKPNPEPHENSPSYLIGTNDWDLEPTDRDRAQGGYSELNSLNKRHSVGNRKPQNLESGARLKVHQLYTHELDTGSSDGKSVSDAPFTVMKGGSARAARNHSSGHHKKHDATIGPDLAASFVQVADLFVLLSKLETQDAMMHSIDNKTASLSAAPGNSTVLRKRLQDQMIAMPRSRLRDFLVRANDLDPQPDLSRMQHCIEEFFKSNKTFMHEMDDLEDCHWFMHPEDYEHDMHDHDGGIRTVWATEAGTGPHPDRLVRRALPHWADDSEIEYGLRYDEDGNCELKDHGKHWTKYKYHMSYNAIGAFTWCCLLREDRVDEKCDEYGYPANSKVMLRDWYDGYVFDDRCRYPESVACMEMRERFCLPDHPRRPELSSLEDRQEMPRAFARCCAERGDRFDWACEMNGYFERTLPVLGPSNPYRSRKMKARRDLSAEKRALERREFAYYTHEKGTCGHDGFVSCEGVKHVKLCAPPKDRSITGLSEQQHMLQMAKFDRCCIVRHTWPEYFCKSYPGRVFPYKNELNDWMNDSFEEGYTMDPFDWRNDNEREMDRILDPTPIPMSKRDPGPSPVPAPAPVPNPAPVAAPAPAPTPEPKHHHPKPFTEKKPRPNPFPEPESQWEYEDKERALIEADMEKGGDGDIWKKKVDPDARGKPWKKPSIWKGFRKYLWQYGLSLFMWPMFEKMVVGNAPAFY